MTGQTHALLAGLTVVAVAVIVRLVRRQVLKAKYTVLWLTVGLVLAVTASVPTLLDRAADRLGIWYQPTLFMLLAIGFLMLLAMHFSYELSRMEKRIRALAEEVALLRGPEDEDRRAPGWTRCQPTASSQPSSTSRRSSCRANRSAPTSRKCTPCSFRSQTIRPSSSGIRSR